MIRDALHRRVPLEATTLVYLFAADRYEHLWGGREPITEQLQSGFVVSDRYLFSSLAYQSVDAASSLVHALNADFPYPEHLIYLDVTPELAEERRSTRRDPDIFENLTFQRTVAAHYETVLRSADGTAMQIHRIDGSSNEEDVARRIWNSLGLPPIS
jgi:dTMP kinase